MTAFKNADRFFPANYLFENADVFLSLVDFEKENGLVPAVIQHARTGSVLMLGYMNAEALTESIRSGWIHFFSRSRSRLWMKGETSGNRLALYSWGIDCDSDALLFNVLPDGPVCHTGAATCWGSSSAGTLDRLQERIQSRLSNPDPASSYTAKLAQEGVARIAQKVGEEGVECALAAVADSPEKLASEAADLLYHLVLLLNRRSLLLDDVLEVLESRAS